MDHTAYKYKIRADETVIGQTYWRPNPCETLVRVGGAPEGKYNFVYPSDGVTVTLPADAQGLYTTEWRIHEKFTTDQPPKSDLPPGAVRLDSLKWDDIFSLSDIIDPYTLRVVVHRRCCPEGDSRPFSHKYQGTTYDLTGHDPSTPVYPVEASFTLKGEPVTFPSCWTEDRVAPGPPHYVAGHAQAEAPHNPVGQAQMNAPAPEPKVDPESAALNRWEEYAAARGGKPHPPK